MRHSCFTFPDRVPIGVTGLHVWQEFGPWKHQQRLHPAVSSAAEGAHPHSSAAQGSLCTSTWGGSTALPCSPNHIYKELLLPAQHRGAVPDLLLTWVTSGHHHHHHWVTLVLLCLTLHWHHCCRAAIPTEHQEHCSARQIWAEPTGAHQFPLIITKKPLSTNPEEFGSEGMPLVLHS